MKKINQFRTLMLFPIGFLTLIISFYVYTLIVEPGAFVFVYLLLFGVLLVVSFGVLMMLFNFIVGFKRESWFEAKFVNIMGFFVGYSEKEKRELIQLDRDNYILYNSRHPRYSTPFHEFTPEQLKEMDQVKLVREQIDLVEEKSRSEEIARMEKARSNNPKTGSNMTFAQGATVGFVANQVRETREDVGEIKEDVQNDGADNSGADFSGFF